MKLVGVPQLKPVHGFSQKDDQELIGFWGYLETTVAITTLKIFFLKFAVIPEP